MPLIIFSFELYSITDDENEKETIFISFMKIIAEGRSPLNYKCSLISLDTLTHTFTSQRT